MIDKELGGPDASLSDEDFVALLLLQASESLSSWEHGFLLSCSGRGLGRVDLVTESLREIKGDDASSEILLNLNEGE